MTSTVLSCIYKDRKSKDTWFSYVSQCLGPEAHFRCQHFVVLQFADWQRGSPCYNPVRYHIWRHFVSNLWEKGPKPLRDGEIYRKPWFLPSNIGVSCEFFPSSKSMISSRVSTDLWEKKRGDLINQTGKRMGACITSGNMPVIQWEIDGNRTWSIHIWANMAVSGREDVHLIYDKGDKG